MNYVKSHKQHLIFLPGWSFKSSIWTNITNLLQDYHTSLLDVPFTTDYADPIVQIAMEIDKQVHHPCILIAWSFSAIIATYLCLKFPGKYQKLVTVTSTPKFVEEADWIGVKETEVSTFYHQAQCDLESVLKNFQHSVSNAKLNIHNILQAHAIETKHSKQLLLHLNILIQSDMREQYKQLNVPVLHIFGSKDRIITSHSALMIQRQYPYHTSIVIHGAGHVPFVSHTQEFIQHLTNFINPN